MTHHRHLNSHLGQCSVQTLLLCVLVLVVGSQGSTTPDTHAEIKKLPGWDGPLPSRMFSGFGQAGTPPGFPNGSMHMHYIWIESEGDPIKDPVIVWYNGGPGASSLFGLLVELGPLLLNANSLEASSSSIPSLIRNPFSWSKVANLLVVNSPPPVGFSFCQPLGPAADGNSCGAWDDALVAKANHHFLTHLFQGPLRPHAPAPLFLTGESYAGVYVPAIAREILQDPRGLNLAGFAVGDGCLGTSVLCGCAAGPYYAIEFFHGHGQVSESLYNLLMSSCPEEQLRSGQLSSYCQELLQQMSKQIGGYFAYGLYDECYWQPGNPFTQLAQRRAWGPVSAHRQAHGSGVTNNSPCPGPAMDAWLALPEVRQALHVPLDSYFFSGDNGQGFTYTLSEKDVRPFHLQVATSTDLRVLVYNGDTDPGMNSFVTQDKFISFFAKNGLALTSEWRPWTLDGGKQLVGYVFEYEGNWSYATIRGAGHMVPEDKPAASLALITAFIRGERLQPYKRASLAAGAASWLNAAAGLHPAEQMAS